MLATVSPYNKAILIHVSFRDMDSLIHVTSRGWANGRWRWLSPHAVGHTMGLEGLKLLSGHSTRTKVVWVDTSSHEASRTGHLDILLHVLRRWRSELVHLVNGFGLCPGNLLLGHHVGVHLGCLMGCLMGTSCPRHGRSRGLDNQCSRLGCTDSTQKVRSGLDEVVQSLLDSWVVQIEWLSSCCNSPGRRLGDWKGALSRPASIHQ